MNAQIRDLIDNANWAVKLLADQARPFNHAYTCQRRLVEAIGAVERAMDDGNHGMVKDGPDKIDFVNCRGE
jgi:hypothetical protein